MSTIPAGSIQGLVGTFRPDHGSTQNGNFYLHERVNWGLETIPKKQIKDQDQDYQSTNSTTHSWSAVVVTSATAEQEQEDQDNQNQTHEPMLSTAVATTCATIVSTT